MVSLLVLFGISGSILSATATPLAPLALANDTHAISSSPSAVTNDTLGDIISWAQNVANGSRWFERLEPDSHVRSFANARLFDVKSSTVARGSSNPRDFLWVTLHFAVPVPESSRRLLYTYKPSIWWNIWGTATYLGVIAINDNKFFDWRGYEYDMDLVSAANLLGRRFPHGLAKWTRVSLERKYPKRFLHNDRIDQVYYIFEGQWIGYVWYVGTENKAVFQVPVSQNDMDDLGGFNSSQASRM